jgi:hypothetical protein
MEARINDESLFCFDENLYRLHILKMIQNVCAISGCPMPSGEYLDTFESCLSSFISKFGFDELSYSEVVLAFELNVVAAENDSDYPSVRFIGKNLSVDFFAKTLNVYVAQRQVLDRKLQNIIDGYGEKIGFDN